MKKTLLIIFILAGLRLSAQHYIDTLYTVAETTVTYGSAVDFAGTSRSLVMDISYPIGDSIQAGGRPVMLLIHGGAFLAGSKDETSIVAMRRQFAQRGYVTAAINYRLGMFQWAGNWNCNISWIFNQPWNCLNMGDTTEWMRGYYRGVQDAHGALRYLMNDSAQFHLNSQKVFVVGESAGAFIAMGVGFMDVPTEKPAGAGALPNINAPNALYELQCIQTPGFAPSIAAMNLSRPDLGPITGTMNPSNIPYRILGVGDMYGATWSDLFAANADDARIPCLYIFHQPADLIVPIDHDRVLQGYRMCADSIFNCANILNRPFCNGGNAIKSFIDNHALQGDSVPEYQAEFTNNDASCLTQYLNPSLGGHQYDNYWTRSYNMAVFFAPKARMVGLEPGRDTSPRMVVNPNPSTGVFRVSMPDGVDLLQLTICNLLGQKVYTKPCNGTSAVLQVGPHLPRGTYILIADTRAGRAVRRIIVE